MDDHVLINDIISMPCHHETTATWPSAAGNWNLGGTLDVELQQTAGCFNDSFPYKM